MAMSSQPNVLGKILDWSAELEPWKSDALRRLFTQGELTEKDRIEVLAMARNSYNIEESSCPQPRPLTKYDLPSRPEPESVPILCSMHDVRNVNALAPAQTITFGRTGITVIYGENASGKSGYSRVLKRACRARHAETILPNIRQQYAPGTKSEALFDLLGNQGSKDTKELKWCDGESQPEELAQFVVFDAHCARVYLTEANEVAYIPYGLDVLPRLAAFLNELKVIIEKEITLLRKTDVVWPGLDGDHEAGRFVRSLTARSDPVAAKRLAKLTDEELAEFHSLEVIIATPDPVLKANTLRRFAKRVENFTKVLESWRRTFGDVAVRALHNAKKEFNEAKTAAALVSARQFTSEALPGIGSDPWKVLYDAAREYSTKHAYPGLPFPVTDEGARCVLCLQSLTAEAKDRFERFRAFMEDSAAAKATAARLALDAAITGIQQTQIDALEQPLLAELHERDEKLAAELVSLTDSLCMRQQMLINAANTGEWEKVNEVDWSVVERINHLLAKIELEASTTEKSASESGLKAAKLRHQELEARIALSKIIDKVCKHIEEQQHAAKLSRLLLSLDTHAISFKQRQIAEVVLNEELESALSTELKRLGVSHLQLNFQHMVRRGTAQHQLHIAGTAGHCDVLAVLSEGEQRVIAIASFLAELSLSPVKAGLIFDDPVSSLDHKWRQRIAIRLVKEAKDRQVIVFTHDIRFLSWVREACAEEQIPLHMQHLSRRGAETGVASDDLPIEALNVKKRIERLSRIIAEAQRAFQADPEGPNYRLLHRDFYDLLRSTWERLVEERLLNEVVMRFEHKVQTQRLREVTVEDQDFACINRAMTHASARIDAHDAPGTEGRQFSNPDEMEQDLATLRDYQRELVHRANSTSPRRKALTEPPSA
jgi:hypothetical protein